MVDDRIALLIVRARIEAHSVASLQAHVRWTTDVTDGFARSINLADPEAVTQLVRSWLRDVDAGARRQGP